MGHRRVLWVLGAVGLLALAGWVWLQTTAGPASVMAPGVPLTKAVGPTDGEPPSHRRAFEVTDAFPTMPTA